MTHHIAYTSHTVLLDLPPKIPELNKYLMMNLTGIIHSSVSHFRNSQNFLHCIRASMSLTDRIPVAANHHPNRGLPISIICLGSMILGGGVAGVGGVAKP